MDQAAILDALTKHMDLLEKISIWALFLSLAIAWAGVQKKDIAALGMTFGRREAFAGSVAVYLFANMVIIVLFFRLGDLLLLLDDKNFLQGITKVGTHTWIMNPYAYFGSDWVARIHSCEGFGLLIVLWWVCHSSLTTLIDGEHSKSQTILTVLFLALGLLAMASVQRVNWVVLHRGTKALPKNIFDEIVSSGVERGVGTFLGIGIGFLFFLATQSVKKRLGAQREHRADARD